MNKPRNEVPPNSKLTPDVIKGTAALISVGMLWYQVADLLGIGTETFRRWRTQGKTDIEEGHNTVYAEFEQAVEKAKFSGIASALHGLQQLIKGYEYTETRVKIGRSGRVEEKIESTKRREPNAGAIIFYLQNRDPENWTQAKMPPEKQGRDWDKTLEEATGLPPHQFVDNVLKQLLPEPEVVNAEGRPASQGAPSATEAGFSEGS